jgi:hypothetical protein
MPTIESRWLTARFAFGVVVECGWRNQRTTDLL